MGEALGEEVGGVEGVERGRGTDPTPRGGWPWWCLTSGTAFRSDNAAQKLAATLGRQGATLASVVGEPLSIPWLCGRMLQRLKVRGAALSTPVVSALRNNTVSELLAGDAESGLWSSDLSRPGPPTRPSEEMTDWSAWVFLSAEASTAMGSATGAPSETALSRAISFSGQDSVSSSFPSSASITSCCQENPAIHSAMLLHSGFGMK